MWLGANIKGNYLEWENLRAQNLGADPAPTAGTQKGLIWFLTSTSLLKVWDGTAVQNLTNLLESVTGTGAISVGAITGKSQQISVAAASGSVPGTMSAADFTKLAGATSLNTASAIVARDGSGNFSAGTITANLSGTASNATTLNSQLATWYLDRANHTGTQLAATISNFDTQVRTNRLDQMAAPTAAVGMGNQKITGMGEPQASSDAATKNYVDSVASGLDVKAAVRLASTVNLTATYTATGGSSARGQITAAPSTFESTPLVANNRILLKNQTTPAQNGIWVVTTVGSGSNGVWDRATDFDTDGEAKNGSFAFVQEGPLGGSGWTLTTPNPITIGGASGTSLTWAQFSGGSTYTAGNGLNLTGSTFSVVGTTNRITSSGSGVDIAATYSGQTSITTLGTITAGTWNGTTIAVANGGTGGTTAATAKTSLGFMTRYAQDFGNGSLTTFTITHSLGTLDVVVEVYENSTKNKYEVDVIHSTTSSITINMGFAPASNAYHVVVIG